MAAGPVIGLCAHVDAGKTTLSESMLFLSGTLRRQGRVDHGDAFLDTSPMEKDRGITIFSKEARLTWNRTELTLLDTPGHTDFSGETERALNVLDAAVLVISAADGVQSHTRTLWRLLEQRNIPVILFLNKTDLPHDPEALSASLRRELSDQIAAPPCGMKGLNRSWIFFPVLTPVLRRLPSSVPWYTKSPGIPRVPASLFSASPAAP